MKRLSLILLALVPFGMTSCHYLWTAPFLWKHQSSAAADLVIGGFIVDLVLIVFCVGVAVTEWKKP